MTPPHKGARTSTLTAGVPTARDKEHVKAKQQPKVPDSPPVLLNRCDSFPGPETPEVEVMVRALAAASKPTCLEAQPVVWRVISKGVSLRLLIDPGTTGLAGCDGLLTQTGFEHLPLFEEVKQTPHVLRLPNGS